MRSWYLQTPLLFVCEFALPGCSRLQLLYPVVDAADTEAEASDLPKIDASDIAVMEDTLDVAVFADAFDAARNFDAEVDPSAIPPPRQIAPPSTSFATRPLPTLRWTLPEGVDGARVEICTDRAMTAGCVSFDAPGTHGAPRMLSYSLNRAYFWRTRGMRGGRVGTRTSPVWEFFVRRSLATRINDTHWGTVVDVNGDGVSDIAVSLDRNNLVYVFRGSTDRGVVPSPFWRLPGPDAGDQRFGLSLSSGGDIDGDGFSDLLAATQGGVAVNPDAGVFSQAQVFVFRGDQNPRGIATDAGAPQADMRATLPGIPSIDGYRTKVTAAGDLDQDGYGDFAVSVVDRAAAGASQLHICRGGATSVTLTQTLTVLGGPVTCAPIAGACDVNGDGFADLVVGCPGAGRAFLLLNDASGHFDEARKRNLTTRVSIDGGVTETTGFGGSVACSSDFDGDGVADIAVGAWGTTGGAAYVYRGRGTWPDDVDPDTTLVGARTPTGYFGNYLATVDDMNGDGYDELAVSALNENIPVSGVLGSGRVYLFLGSAAVFTNGWTSPITYTNPSSMPVRFGQSLAGGGDTDGDGNGEFFGGWDQSGPEVRGFRLSGTALIAAIGTPLLPVSPGSNFGAHLATGSSQSP